MKKIAITGGIGTGKSFVARLFADNGFPVFDADAEAKNCYRNPHLLQWLQATCSAEVVHADGTIDYKKLGEWAFQNEDNLKKLNEKIHPILYQEFLSWTSMQTTDCVMMESAILFESGFDRFFDFIIVVTAPQALQISRIQQRNPKWSVQHIEERLKAQWPQNKKIALADAVVLNDGSALLPQVERIIAQIGELP